MARIDLIGNNEVYLSLKKKIELVCELIKKYLMKEKIILTDEFTTDEKNIISKAFLFIKYYRKSLRKTEEKLSLFNESKTHEILIIMYLIDFYFKKNNINQNDPAFKHSQTRHNISEERLSLYKKKLEEKKKNID